MSSEDRTKANDELQQSEKKPAEATYPVGYGRPPESGKFKKGESGNPRGRPRKHKNRRTIVADVLGETVNVIVGKRRRTMTKYEVAFHAQTNKAMKGDSKAFLLVDARAKEHGVLEDRRLQGVVILPAPVGPEEYMRLYGKAARGTPVPQEVVDRIERVTKNKD